MARTYTIPRHVIAGGGGTSTASTRNALGSGPRNSVMCRARTIVSAQHLSELRIAILQTYLQGGLPLPTFDEPLIPGSMPVKAPHVSQLRAALAFLEEY